MAASQKLQDDVASSLQSLISSTGGECRVDSLYKDYRDLIGSSVPVKQLGHESLASFLLSLPELFHCSNRGGIVFVRLKDDTSSHISRLSRQQKTATRKIKGRPKPARRPGPSSWAPSHDIRLRGSIHQNWREPFRPLHVGFNPSRPRNPGTRGGERKLYCPPQKIFGNIRSQAPPRRPEYPSAKALPPNKPKSPPPLPNLSKTPPPPKSSKSPPPPKTSKSPPPFKAKSPPLISTRPPLLPTPPMTPIIPIPPIPKINPPSALYYNDGNFSFPRAIRDNQEKQFAPYFEVPPRFKKMDNKEATYKRKLEEEMKKKGLNQDLVFRSIPCGKKNKHWVSMVNINGVTVSSYPEEFSLVQEAEEEAAKKALDVLQETQEPSNLPSTRNLMVSIERVKQILHTQDRGMVWLDRIQDLYKQEFKETLPKNWAQEVQNYNNTNNITYGVVVDNPVQDRWTVQMKEQEPPNVIEQHRNVVEQYPSIMEQHLTQPADSQVDSSALYECMRQQYLSNQVNEAYQQQVSETYRQQVNETYQQQGNQKLTEQELQNVNVDSLDVVADGLGGMKVNGAEDIEDLLPRLPVLELPVASYWDIYVTFIEDLSSIHFRLIGDNYSNAYDDLVTEMELYYMEDKNMSPVSQPKIGHIYAASHDESWCRVKVLSVSGSDVTVNFLDHGDQETLNISQLHKLHEKFFKLPAQGVCCSLAGLEFGGRDRSALNLLQNLALGQTLVAQVVSRDNNISLIVYNTTTEDDVNINEKVSEEMDQNFEEPVFPSEGGVVEVYLIHTTATGDVYVQVETETYKVLQNLLEMARSRTEEMLGEDVKIDLTRLYLARFSEDGEWYRAVPRANVDPNGKALFCRLNNVPASEGLQWTSRACQRILDLVPEDSPLLLKVHSKGVQGGPPLVELFKRLHPKNELVSINATLSMDDSLFSCDGDSNNNNVRKEVILSPTRMRNRCSSSNSLTSGSSGVNSGPSSITGISDVTSRASSPLDMSKRFQQPGSLMPMDIPSIGDFFDVYITYAASPSNFAVQPWKMTHKVTTLMEDMQKYYSNPDNLKAQTEVKVGGYFAVKHTDSFWYRAYLTMANQGIVTGLFVDYGDCFVVTPDSVQPLPSIFHSLPCQAIKAKLAGVLAANLDWRPEDSYRFKELVEYRELVSIITNVEQEKDTEEFVLSLRLVDTSDPRLDVYIDEILVNEKRAIKLNE